MKTLKIIGLILGCILALTTPMGILVLGLYILIFGGTWLYFWLLHPTVKKIDNWMLTSFGDRWRPTDDTGRD